MSGAPNKKLDDEDDLPIVEVDESLAGDAEQVRVDEAPAKKAARESEEDERLEADQRPDEDDDDDDDQPGDSEDRRRRRKNSKSAQARIRRREMFNAMEARVAEQQRVIEQLSQQVGQQVGQTVESQYRNALDHVRRAEQAMKDAVERGDGDEHVKALRYRDEAIAAARAIAPRVEQVRRAGGTAQAPQPQMQPDPELIRRTTTWAQKNPWFSPNGADPDSAVVKAIDNEVAAAGFDPRTSDYWDELNDRLREKLPHRFKVGERKGPSIGGRGEITTSAGKKTYRIAPEMRAALEEAGIWDDEKRRAKVLADHFRILKTSR
jgi:uncharacterized coiled-coil protein SlyX